MNIEVSGQGLEVTDALEKYVTNRLSGIQRRSHKKEDRVEVVLGIEGSRSHVAIHARIGNGVHDVKSESHDMYLAIDEANHKLHRVLEDSHDKTIEGKRRN